MEINCNYLILNFSDGITVPTLLEVYENSNRVKFSDLGLGESICAASAQDGSAYMWGGTLLVCFIVLTLGTSKSHYK